MQACNRTLHQGNQHFSLKCQRFLMLPFQRWVYQTCSKQCSLFERNQPDSVYYCSKRKNAEIPWNRLDTDNSAGVVLQHCVDLSILGGLLNLASYLLNETTGKNFSVSCSSMTRLTANILCRSEEHIFDSLVYLLDSVYPVSSQHPA